MKKLFLFVLLTTLSNFSFAQLDDLSPNYFLYNYTGFQVANQKFADGSQNNGWGIWSIGIPQYTPSFNFKKKVYLGGYIGLEIGVGFSEGDLALLARLPLGFSAGYRMSDDLFISGKYFAQVQAGSVLQGSSDDGWVYGGTIRYKNMMLDFHKNLGGTTSGGILKGRMGYNNLEIFPKYIFRFSDWRWPCWVGIRYSIFTGKDSLDTFDSASTFEILIGQITFH